MGWSYTVVTTARDCIFELHWHKDRYDLIFLDHDLGGEQMVDSKSENSGSAVARDIGLNEFDRANWKTPVVIHSFNPIGAEYMQKYIPGSVRLPGIWSDPEKFKATFKR